MVYLSWKIFIHGTNMHKHLANTLRTTWCRHGLSVVQTISGVLWPRPRCWCLGTETSAEQSLATSRQVTAACEALGKPPPWKHEIGRTTRTNNNLQVFSVQDLNLLVSLVSNLIELRRFFLDKMAQGLQKCVCVFISELVWSGHPIYGKEWQTWSRRANSLAAA